MVYFNEPVQVQKVESVITQWLWNNKKKRKQLSPVFTGSGKVQKGEEH